MSREVCERVRYRQRGKCACGCGRRIAPFPIGFHHVFPKGDRMWPELVNEPRNIVGLAADCHANHETGMTRLPRSAVAIAEALVADARMGRYLETHYT